MIIHDLSTDAIAGMVRADLARLDRAPDSPIGEFGFNRCEGAVGSFIGRPPWERHSDGDELLLVLSGATQLTLVEPQGETSRWLEAGQLVVVPQGCWHVNDAPDGVTMFHLTPREGNENTWERPAPG